MFLYHISRVLDALATTLGRGERPEIKSLAQQLCLHVAIDHARGLACAYGDELVGRMPISNYDYYFDKLYDTLLPGDEHEHLVELARTVGNAAEPLDFIALGDLLAGTAMGALFAPYEHDHRVA
ncbi:hypothetical protein C5E45_30915 [Nocardia nova]|uniref:Uncharacterized protein n=1 Tax=Nocardia nova TaxID=37330 RepID=A0A2S6AGR3_9NOCA|nr:hypothetical protein [Nocardia nova]PPJ21610.1 hypothetical protein C5E41_29255 [Nocardia nova]PPJ33940.1 hypothetical protein C5E45_30915 [Nocardia nova]